MNSPSNDAADLPVESEGIAPATLSPKRPMWWSVRREIFENRSIYIAPLIVAATVLLATSISIMVTLPRIVRNHPGMDAAKQHSAIEAPFSMAPAPIMMATFIVAIFYCVDALYGERRDRSILFWKSMPVSDRTTVLSKMTIPMVVLPLIALLLSVITFAALLMLGTLVLAANGMSPAPLWREVHVIQEPLVMLYGLIVHALWFAPIYAWLLLVSAWARRAPFLWAVLPLLPAAFERIAFKTSYLGSILKYRVVGAMAEAFTPKLIHLTPGRFLTSAGLWTGLAFAALFLAAAVRLRRYREPI